ncbi:MAG: anti-sigma factor [Granulosicoccus sp.]
MDSDNDRDWWDAQAGEYVLGTLDETEQKVFVQLLKSEKELVEKVRQWEAHLQPLSVSNQADVVSPGVWQGIAQQLEFDITEQPSSLDSTVVSGSTNNVRSPIAPIEVGRVSRQQQSDKLARWRRAAALAMVASFLLAVVLIEKIYTTVAPVGSQSLYAISIVQNDGADPLWIVNVLSSSSEVQLIALSPPEIASDSVHQLWLVKANDQGVASLGLLPSEPGSSVTVPISEAVIDTLDSAIALAVSLEPAGGSPLPTPSGSVVYQADIKKLLAL